MHGQQGDHSQLERAILQLVRLGLAGDQGSVRQLARQLVRRPPAGIIDAPVFREELGHMLLAADTPTRPTREARAAPIPRDTDSSLPLIVSGPELPLDPPILNDADKLAVDAFIREQLEAGRLAAAGLTPVRTLLLTGAPGVGKTMTARFISRSLELPLLSLDLATLMSSYLGRTGQNLRRALDYARTTRCVLFLDEFDALAKRRDDDSEVGELKRLVNVLLLELERWPSDSILVAATNHPEILDRAVERRFDLIVDLQLPDLASRVSILETYLESAGTALGKGMVQATGVATEGWSGSDLARLSRLVRRRCVLEGTPPGRGLAEELTRLLATKAGMEGQESLARAAFCAVATEEGGLSHREVGRILGVSHPTVGRLIRQWHSWSGKGVGDGEPRTAATIAGGRRAAPPGG